MNKERAEQIALMLLRVVAGLIFCMHGGQKLFGWFGGMPGGAKLQVLSQVGIGGILEFVGGIMILCGLGTRITAFILSGEMAVAYFQFHQPMGLTPVENHGDPAVLYCFIFLYLAARGAGDYSFDAIVSRARLESNKAAGRPATQS